MDSSGQPTAARSLEPRSGAKLRRLRAALRHEQQSIAVALASALHHSADKTTRAQHNAPRGQKNAGTEYYELSDEDEVPARVPGHPVWEPRGPQDRDPAAHHGAGCRLRPYGTDSGYSCARSFTRRFFGPRAGYRRAQDLSAFGSPGAAEGGTVGGSAEDRVTTACF